MAAQRELLDGLRRAFMNLQTRKLPEMDQRLRDAIAEVAEVVKADADLKNGLELTIPLIPPLLDYNVNLDLGGGLDLRQWGEKAREAAARWVSIKPCLDNPRHDRIERTHWSLER